MVVHLPTSLNLLWELEGYLRPCAFGKYPLTPRALRLASQQGDTQRLITLLELGTAQPVSGELKARILEQPVLRMIQGGILLEFSHASELQRLRHDPTLRSRFEQMLSPRHVYLLPSDASSVMRMLERRGVYVSPHREELEPKVKPSNFHLARAKMLQPVGRAVPLLSLLERYIHLQQAVDILYRIPGYPAEHRRITPLLIEQRGEYQYVSAYCQTRRANRTFRLDRIEISGTISAG